MTDVVVVNLIPGQKVRLRAQSWEQRYRAVPIRLDGTLVTVVRRTGANHVRVYCLDGHERSVTPMHLELI